MGYNIRSAPFNRSSKWPNSICNTTIQSRDEKDEWRCATDYLSRFLFGYSITPHATTGLFPAEVMLSRRLTSVFVMLMPDVKSKLHKKQ